MAIELSNFCFSDDAENTNCFLCAELVRSRNWPTWGHGRKGGLMFIGEAPGQQGCNITGKPFHGDRTGALFELMLKKSLGLLPEDVYITNAVKCSPPFNRQPDGEELRACSVFLQHEIICVKPAKIICVGVIAVRALNLLSFMPNIPIIHIWHPGFLLRKPQAMAEWEIQWQKIK